MVFGQKWKIFPHSSEICRSRRLEVFRRKDALKFFAKFTGKHLCQSLFFNKGAGGACNFIKKRLAQVFSSEFCEIAKNTFFTEHVWATASFPHELSFKCCLSVPHHTKILRTFTVLVRMSRRRPICVLPMWSIFLLIFFYRYTSSFSYFLDYVILF